MRALYMHMKVREIMYSATKVPSWCSISRAACLMEQRQIRSLVVEGRRKKGLLTTDDIMKKTVALGKNPTKVKAGKVMSFPMVTIDLDAHIEEAEMLMHHHKIGRLVVEEKGSPVGIVSKKSIKKHRPYNYAKRMLKNRR